MTSQIDYDYYDWLVSQIEVRGTRTYNDLFERMHNTEFVWTVVHDDSRVTDALDLRYEFANNSDFSRKEIGDFRAIKGASVLEVVIALSRRVAFNAVGSDRDARMWAWQLIKNLRLHKMSDPFTSEKAANVEEILHTLIWRTYNRDGDGGFFPLRKTWVQEDQRKVEIWYQMHKYLNEIEMP